MDSVPLPASLGPVPPIADELDEAILVGHVDSDDAPEAVRAWYPATPEEAEWCLRKLAALEAREAAVEERYLAWKEPVDAWRADELHRLRPAKAFFSGRLQAYGLLRRAEDPKGAKTTRLPSGTIATRGGEDPKAAVADEAAVLAWASATLTGDEYDSVVKVEESVKIGGLRKIVAVRESPPLLPPQDWQPITGHWVADPDGWRGSSGRPWTDPIDKAEFLLRASISTTAPGGEPSEPEPPMEYVVVHVATGEVVPGVGYDLPDITATVKVDR